MFNSAVLDVAIGLAFIFLLTSLLVSAAVEALAGVRKWRSQHLWDGLEQLLQSAEVRDELYRHPLIKGLTRVRVDAKELVWESGRNGPSYIPSRTFALALIDILRRPHEFVSDVEQRLQHAVADAARNPAKALEAIESLVREVDGAELPTRLKREIAALGSRVLARVDPAVVAELKERVRNLLERCPESDRTVGAAKISEWLAEHADAAVTYLDLRSTLTAAIGSMPFAGSTSASEQLRTALATALQEFPHGYPEEAAREIQAFSHDAVKRWLEEASPSFQATVAALTPLARDAAGSVDLFRENIEIWFNDGMDRVSGWYKRHASFVQGIVALGLAVFMNIDALQITRTLWREPTLRQSLVANAEALARNPPPSVSEHWEVPAAETVSSTIGAALKARLTTVRLTPGGMARATVTLPNKASANDSVAIKRVSAGAQSETRREEDATPSAASTNASIFLGENAHDVSMSALTITPGEGTTQVEFFIKAGPVTTASLEKVQVDYRGQIVTPALVIGPTSDNNFAALQAQIGGLGLPIGWSCPDDAASRGADLAATVGGPVWCTIPPGFSGRRWTSASWLRTNLGAALGMLVSMLFGWGITAAAASYGAPFWFDMLKRIISIRTSGKAPEERPLSPKAVSQPREPGQRPREADLLGSLQR